MRHKPGVAATGTPINLGAIVTDQPGTNLTDGTNMAQAYFTCVNANGGVNGHPIKYYIETAQTNPAQIAGLARVEPVFVSGFALGGVYTRIEQQQAPPSVLPHGPSRLPPRQDLCAGVLLVPIAASPAVPA